VTNSACPPSDASCRACCRRNIGHLHPHAERAKSGPPRLDHRMPRSG
jgi:hypothetical protein